MTRKRDKFWEHAEQLGNRFRCKFCNSDFASGILKIKSHLAGISTSDVPPCTVVPQPIRAEASAAITAQKGKTKSSSRPIASTPLAEIQKVDASKTSTTDEGQDCLDELLPKHVPESSNRAEILGERADQAAKLNVVVLGGEPEEVDPKWDQLQSHIISRGSKEGKAILSDHVVVNLEGGTATLGDFIFTPNSSRMRSGKYRLGVKVACRCYAMTHIEGAISEAIFVEDSHGEFVKKHFLLLPSDYVRRIVGVGMGGQAHKLLTGAGIVIVRDFFHLLCLDATRLRNIMGGGISDAMWKHTWEYATSQVSDDKDYVYYLDQGKKIGILFNWNFEPKDSSTMDSFN